MPEGLFHPDILAVCLYDSLMNTFGWWDEDLVGFDYSPPAAPTLYLRTLMGVGL